MRPEIPLVKCEYCGFIFIPNEQGVVDHLTKTDAELESDYPINFCPNNGRIFQIKLPDKLTELSLYQ